MNAVATQTSLSPARAAQQRLLSQPLKLLNAAAARALVEAARKDPSFDAGLLRAECQSVQAAVQPAQAVEIAVLIHRLSLHYPDRKLNQQEAQLVTEDWLEDLDGLSHDLIELAFKRWRQGPKCAFFPKAGEILALVNHEMAIRKLLAKRAEEVEAGLRGKPMRERDQQSDQHVQRIIEGGAA